MLRQKEFRLKNFTANYGILLIEIIQWVKFERQILWTSSTTSAHGTAHVLLAMS